MRRVNPPSLAAPSGFSHAVVASGTTVFLAGQTGMSADGTIVPGGVVAQFEQALGNLLTALTEAGGSPTDLASLTIYVVDIKKNTEVWRARREFFTGDFPASTLVEVRSLAKPDVLVEIEAVAYLGRS